MKKDKKAFRTKKSPLSKAGITALILGILTLMAGLLPLFGTFLLLIYYFLLIIVALLTLFFILLNQDFLALFDAGEQMAEFINFALPYAPYVMRGSMLLFGASILFFALSKGKNKWAGVCFGFLFLAIAVAGILFVTTTGIQLG